MAKVIDATEPVSAKGSAAAGDEELLTVRDVAGRLRVSVRQFYRLRAKLIARGLQEVTVGQQKRYRKASLNRLIQQAGVTGKGFPTENTTP